MFASFTSMLPSGISFGANKDERERDRQERVREHILQDDTPRPRDVGQLLDDYGKPKDAAADDLGVKKRRERNPNETFIVVRPPPSVSNHPLNLQLQLVPPQAKERSVSASSGLTNISSISNRRSVDYTANPPESAPQEIGVPLTSTRSNRSDPSSFYESPSSASTASMSSIASSTSSAGGRRMIVPLYNLSAHNVMTNTVLDAGTDAKVARFHKRGMEILALAVLECIEVWPSYGRGGSKHVAILNPTANGASAGLHDSDALLHTPTSSAISLSSAGSHPPNGPSLPTAPMTPAKNTFTGLGSLPSTPAQSGTKKIFGKIFKKKDSQVSGQARSTVAPSPSTSSEAGHGIPKASKRRSLNLSSVASGASPITAGTHISTSGSVGLAAQPILQPPILGIQPTLSAPLAPPVGRPTRYVWIVRKWLKGGDGGLLGGVMRGVGMVGAGIGVGGLAERPGSSNGEGSGGRGGGDGNGQSRVELRFEWVREISKRKGGKRRSTGQAVLGKRASLPRVDSQVSLGSGPSGRQISKSRTSVRRSNTAASPATAAPRMSSESRRSREGSTSRDSRTNSINSTTLSEDAACVRGSKSPSTAPRDLPDENEGEVSDPEDSETPWTCTLVISSMPSNPSAMWEHEHATATGDMHHPLSSTRSRASAAGHSPLASSATVDSASAGYTKASRPHAPGTLLRLKIGTLSPAPHHPKVVAQLKVPFPLPDIEVERAHVRRRVVTPSGIARPAVQADEDASALDCTVLAAEEIKDVLSCTAFWIVVREGFGGVGKVNRKGDGWRIRG